MASNGKKHLIRFNNYTFLDIFFLMCTTCSIQERLESKWTQSILLLLTLGRSTLSIFIFSLTT